MEFMPDHLKDPSYDTEEEPIARMLVTDFGDGYQQRTPDGINNVKRKWSGLLWKRRSTECYELWQFLYPYFASGQPFLWMPPTMGGEPQKEVKVWVSSLKRTFVGPDAVSVTATFEEVFDL